MRIRKAQKYKKKCLSRCFVWNELDEQLSERIKDVEGYSLEGF